MRRLTAFAVTLLVAGGLPAHEAQAQDGPSAQAMVQTCYVCHGPQGKSAEAVPPLLLGQKEFTQRQMLDFKADRRPATIMNRIAKGYSDAEIAAIADYLATLK